MTTELIRKVHVAPSYHHIRPEPNRDYGIAACRIFFYVIGPAGAVQWQISTDWYTKQLVEGFRAGGTDWLWPKLEEYWRCVFEDGPWPDFSPTYQKHPDDGLTEEEYNK